MYGLSPAGTVIIFIIITFLCFSKVTGMLCQYKFRNGLDCLHHTWDFLLLLLGSRFLLGTSLLRRFLLCRGSLLGGLLLGSGFLLGSRFLLGSGFLLGSRFLLCSLLIELERPAGTYTFVLKEASIRNTSFEGLLQESALEFTVGVIRLDVIFQGNAGNSASFVAGSKALSNHFLVAFLCVFRNSFGSGFAGHDE